MFPHQSPSNKKENEKGSLLVEIVIVAGIVAGSLTAILGVATTFLVISHVVQQTSQATALAQEGLEIVRNYRDGTSWSAGLGAVAYGPTVYHSVQSGNPPQWTFVSGSETINEFSRQIVFAQVCRNASANIVACPGSSTDANSKKATVTVSWQERGRSHKVELTAYFTNWK